MSKASGATYEIKSIRDIFEQIPLNRLGAFMKDLKSSVRVFHGAQSLFNAMSAAYGEMAEPLRPLPNEKFIWIDDGKHKITLVFNEEPTMQEAVS